MAIYRSISELIGNTPLMELAHYNEINSLCGAVYAKLEYFNPAGSVKDRVAREIIAAAEAEGKLKEGSVIIEPTSGNTGIGLAAIAAAKGYKAIIVMPDSMSEERRLLMKAYGAELVLTDGALGMTGAIAKAEELAASLDSAFIAGQFINPANPLAHYKTTGPELYADLGNKIDVLVAGVGTGGTLSGTAKYLKEKIENIEIVAVEPADSPLISSGKAGAHKLQGIGANFIPDTLDTEIYDKVVTVTTEEAYSAAASLARTEGVFTGVSSGAALFAATSLARQPEYSGKNIVVILPDTGERYLSTEDFIK